jgi:tRNA pseudouridine55 synthase
MQISSEGLYLLNKPRGRSSFSIVAQVRRVSGIKKVGHAGTLDPEAEGLLIVLVGKEFTKQAEKYSKLDKTYEFEIKLGENSTTDDEEGDKTKVSKKVPTKAEITKVIADLTGEITQTPPAYSAIKIGGQRAYKLARKGENPDIPSRKVTIENFKILSYDYPLLKLSADVSSGTYIRSLARTIGEELGTGAYCTQIVRTRIGQYKLSDAIAVD